MNNILEVYVLPSVTGFGGWGNGYVAIPPGHRLHGKEYHVLNECKEISVNGGLTYADVISKQYCRVNNLPKKLVAYWAVGFDTSHSWNSIKAWPKKQVQKEALNLRNQLNKIAAL